MSTLPVHTALRYVEPLREGGSLPAVVDTDRGLFGVKFRGAGQGPPALVAEVVVGGIARAAGLPVPGLALVDVDPVFGRSEPDPEIQDLLRASHGLNVGIRYLPGAFNFDARAAGELVDAALAAEIVWLDAFVTNPDRTHRNPNLMVQDRRPWLIDHGAALYHQHDWSRVDADRTRAPFSRLGDHVLLEVASDPADADERVARRLHEGVFAEIVGQVPDALLPAGDRERHVAWLEARYRDRAAWVADARRRWAEARERPAARREYRR